ncbi:DUF937 domain-containing protein [Sphingomonas oleivorans]|nr:DUF937 domain-containing protein [Sphingomonas oleivorans]
MSLLNLLTQSGGASAISQIGARVGLSPEQTQSAMAALLPALAGGLKQQAQRGELPSAPATSPDQSASDASVAQGNNILGQIFGSKDVSRSVAADAAAKTGIDVGQLKALLPMLATLAAGTVAAKAGSSAGGLEGIVAMLDSDRDGNPLDDIMGMAGKLFGR